MARTTLSLLMLGVCLLGCETLKPYEKEYLLNPLMDDAEVASLQPALMSSANPGAEKLGGGAVSGGTSCPTCGG